VSGADIEICINATAPAQTQASVSAAYAGGAHRVELCTSMHLEGLTPAQRCIEVARTAFMSRPGIVVMIRPRGGHFFYNRQEITLMCQQIAMAAGAGADGVALGALAESGKDLHASMPALVSCAKEFDLKVTLHRAFDALPDPHETLEAAIGLGIDRVLSSGTPWGSSAGVLEGIDVLEALCRRARGRIEIVAAGGISPKNAAAIARSLTQAGKPVSLHSYSGVEKNGITSEQLVRSLKQFSPV